MTGQRLFGKFEIIECLKQDVATVYLAQHVFLEKQILLKVLDTSVVQEKAVLQRFQREARILARLEHPNIIKVLDFGFQDTFFYISFEYFESQNLREIIKTRTLPNSQKQDLLRQLFIGISYAHDHGIIHRDIKPENILVNSAFELKIADFGLALHRQDSSVTAQTSIVGTPGYMAPEQIRGEKTDARTDLFAAGILSYELFTGTNPFLGENISITLNNILSGVGLEFDRSEIPVPFSEIIPQLLKRNRNERIQNAHAVLDMMGISRVKAAGTTPVAAAQPVKKKSEWYVKKWPFVVLFMVLAVGGWLTREWQSAREMARVLMHYHAASVSAVHVPVVSDNTVSRSSKTMMTDESGTPAEIDSAAGSESGFLLVKCMPWANIWIDDRFLETTPMKHPALVPRGEYRIRFRHPHYPEYVKNIRIHPAKLTTIAVNLDTLYGYFLPQIYPWGKIEIDGEPMGETPFTDPLILPPGRHRLVVKNQYFEDVTRWLEISRWDTLVMALDLSTTASRRQ